MVFADASLCGQTGAAGWGAWVKRDGGVSEVFGAEFRDTMANSTAAEIAALANALHRAVSWRLIEHGDTVMLQSDCVNALARIRRAIPASFDSPAPGKGVAVGPTKRPKPDPVIEAAADHIKRIVEDARLTVVTRHVKGHRAGPGRQWVNTTCDQEAKRHMRARREALTTKAKPNPEGITACS